MIREFCFTALAALAFNAHTATAGQAWRGHAGNPQHTAQALAPAQNLNRILWQTPIDLKPSLRNNELLIHYGSLLITPANTLILPVKFGLTNGFRLTARTAATGALLWSINSDYSLPPHDWVPSFGPQLTLLNRVYFPGAGGTVIYRDTPDQATGATGRQAFYGIDAYTAKKNVFNAAVRINTPISSDNAGNIYFGFQVLKATPNGLRSGIARIAADGTGKWIAAADASADATITQVQTNGAPAVSADGRTIYVVVSDTQSGYLLALDSTTLQTQYKVRLKDPSSGSDAWITNNSSAAPMVAPDGDVFIGVLERPFPKHNDRGWLLHFDATLTTSKMPGAFGWDSTPSLVPVAAVPDYNGTATYLILSKYNNYQSINTGNGQNRIAMLDPTAGQADFVLPAVTVMKEVKTVLEPSQFPGAPVGSRYEWCINTAAIDVATHSAFAHGEDGFLYRWDLATGALSQSIQLNTPRPEAYTWTVVGPDGTVYAINNATMYAVGN